MDSAERILEEIQSRINRLEAMGIPATLLATWRDGSLIKLSALSAVQLPLVGNESA